MPTKRDRRPTRADFERARELLQRFQMEISTSLPIDISTVLAPGIAVAYQRMRQMESCYALDASFKKQKKKDA